MRFLLLPLFLLPWTVARSQIKDYVQHETHPIRTISPDSLDFSDLDVVGQAVGDKRIVMLGEQDHGDAPTFLAKTRLIKYLHERKGFNVVVFEGDFFSLTQGYGETSPEKMGDFLKHNIFPIWSYCDGCTDLFSRYIPDHSRELKVVGVDLQMIFGFGYRFLRHRLDSVLRRLDLPVTHEEGYTTIFLPMVDSLPSIRWYRRVGKATLDSVADWAARAGDQARTKLSKDDFWVHVLDNLRDEARMYVYAPSNDRKRESEIRDRRMAENLAWFADVVYPNEKLIVWAANPHVAKLRDEPAMGGYFTEDTNLDKETYVIGFTGFQGEGGRFGAKPYTIPPPSGECFENWVDPAMAFAFTDLSGYKDKTRFRMRFWYYREDKNAWSRIFDGVFFIRENRRCAPWPKAAGPLKN
ncbi:erythromycin esterase family protein [Dinghuibacter silviterrae]|uniref:Erythromycin esterase-like protein n=1 Tax=Dinghuibacter silviterrae TaxID=1539049 RepID=A0A4R8DRI4_9BACT|nr:erythromycin esterase family protein [Dinghuibacter silviterrae]TDW99750.1 erythromycin esterase-like protein [Dinghuibacter silviterrae]